MGMDEHGDTALREEVEWLNVQACAYADMVHAHMRMCTGMHACMMCW